MVSLQGAWCAFLLLGAACWARHRFSRRIVPVPGDLLCAARWVVVGLTLQAPFLYSALVLGTLFGERDPRARLRLELLLLPAYLAAHLGEWPGVLAALASAGGLRWLLGHLAQPPRGWAAPFESHPRLRSACRIAAGTLALGWPLLGGVIPPWQYALALFAFGVGGSPWRRRGAPIVAEGTAQEAAAVVSLLGPRARARLREQLSDAQKKVLLDSQPDYLTATEQAALRRRFVELGPVLSCATVLDRCPIEELSLWLRCWPDEVRTSFLAMLDCDTREAVAQRMRGHRMVPEGVRARMLERYPDAPRLSLDEMVELWPRWFARELVGRCCLQERRLSAPVRRSFPLPRLPFGKPAALLLGLVLAWGWPRPEATRGDALAAFGGRLIPGPRESVAVVPPGVEAEAVRWLVGAPVQVFHVPARPAAPVWPWLVGALGLGLVWLARRPQRPPAPAPACPRQAEKPRPPLDLDRALQVDPLCIEVGRGLLGLVDPNQGAPMLEQATLLRKQAALELGIVVPGIRFRDNLKLKRNEVRISLREVELGRLEVPFENGHGCQQLLAVGAPEEMGPAGLDPVTGEGGRWIHTSFRGEAEQAGARLLTLAEYVGLHFKALVFAHAAELLPMQEVDLMLKQASKEHPTTVEVAREAVPLHELAAFLRQFLRLRGTLRDLPVILEIMLSQRTPGTNPCELAERCVPLYRGST